MATIKEIIGHRVCAEPRLVMVPPALVEDIINRTVEEISLYLCESNGISADMLDSEDFVPCEAMLTETSSVARTQQEIINGHPCNNFGLASTMPTHEDSHYCGACYEEITTGTCAPFGDDTDPADHACGCDGSNPQPDCAACVAVLTKMDATARTVRDVLFTESPQMIERNVRLTLRADYGDAALRMWEARNAMRAAAVVVSNSADRMRACVDAGRHGMFGSCEHCSPLPPRVVAALRNPDVEVPGEQGALRKVQVWLGIKCKCGRPSTSERGGCHESGSCVDDLEREAVELNGDGSDLPPVGPPPTSLDDEEDRHG